MTVRRFISRPTYVDAVQNTGDFDELACFAGEERVRPSLDSKVTFEVQAGRAGESGWVKLPHRHWLLRSGADLWPCTPARLDHAYREVVP